MKGLDFKKKILIATITLIIFTSVLLPAIAISAVFMNMKNKDGVDTKIQLIAFNDFHGNVIEADKNVGSAKFVAEVNRLKAEDPNTFVVSAGDLYQGTAISNLLLGEPVNEMLKQLGVKYSAVGNHEFDWGVDNIEKWSKDVGMEFIACNIYDKNTQKPVEWAKPYGIIEASGKKIGILGLATPETAYKTNMDAIVNLEFKDIVESSKPWVEHLRNVEKVDALVVVGHIPSEQNETTGDITGEAADLANRVSGIDVVVSAHSHKFVNGKVNGVPVIQAGYYGRGLSKIEFNFDKSNNLKVEAIVDKLYERVDSLQEDSITKEIINNYNKDIKPIMSEVVVTIDTKLEHDRFLGLSPLGEFISKYLAQAGNSQIGIINGGGVRRPLNSGNVTVGDMWEIMPFDNYMVTMKLKGSDLKRVIENGIMNKSIGWVQYYGLKVYYDKDAQAGNRITSMRLLDGTKVKDDEYYTVTTMDFIYNKGDNYDFTGAIDVVETRKPVRDTLISLLKSIGSISFRYDNDILVAGKDPTIDKDNTLNTNNELPNTGSVIDLKFVETLGFMLVGAGVMMAKKKQEDVS